MGVNWDILQPIRPVAAQEVASINGLLSAFADRRMKQQQLEAEQAFQQKKFLAEEANRQHDNINADKLLKLQQDQFGAQKQQAQAAALAKDQDQARAELEKSVLPALQNDRPDQARVGAQAAGIGFNQNEADLAPGQVAPAQPSTRYHLTLPAGQVVDYDPIEAQNAQKAARQKLTSVAQEQLGGVKNTPNNPFAEKAAEMTMSAVGLDAKPEEVSKTYQGYLKQLTAEAAAARNAETMSRAAQGRHEATTNQGAVRELNTEVKAFANEQKIPDLNKAKEKFGQAYEQLIEGAKSHNPKAIAAGVDSLIGAYKNGTVTGAALQYFTKDSSSWLERLENIKAKALSGGYGDTTVREFTDTVQSGLKQLNRELEEKERAFNQSTYNNPSYQDLWSNVDAHHDRLFPGIDTRSAGQEPPGEAAGITLTGKTIKKTPKTTPKGAQPASPETRARLEKLESELGVYSDKLGGSR